jgi:hypothetical protein
MEMHRKRQMVNLWFELSLIFYYEERCQRLIYTSSQLLSCRLSCLFSYLLSYLLSNLLSCLFSCLLHVILTELVTCDIESVTPAKMWLAVDTLYSLLWIIIAHDSSLLRHY